MLWTANGSRDSIYDGIRLDNYDGNTEGFIIGKYDVELPGIIDNTMLGNLILPNLENKLYL